MRGKIKLDVYQLYILQGNVQLDLVKIIYICIQIDYDFVGGF